MLQRLPRSRYVCPSCSLRLSKQSNRNASTRFQDAARVPSTPARTRFAPSPTGYLHLGSLRTALFNYLLAKRTGGQFLLRIEDTDRKRTVPGAEERIIKDLRWAGLDWDEGPDSGGPYGPYRQSERSSIYKSHAETLVRTSHAYRCFCSPERLKAVAEINLKIGLHTQYDRTCYHIPLEESDDRASQGQEFIVRLKDPERQPFFKDLVQGQIRDGKVKTALQKANDSFDDPVLLKTDGLPTYHLANVVDDHLMNITHVIRGAEWIVSTRKHLIMYDAFGWTPPIFGHVGLLLDKAGSKLSKREKAFDLTEMQEDGVLPEALNNFLVLLGWEYKQQKSDFATMATLKEQFDLRLTKGNPTVSLEKLWYLSPKHAQLRVLDGGAAFEGMVDLVVAAVHKFVKVSHTSATLPIVTEAPEVLREYVSRAVQSDSKNYITALHFVENHPYYFLNDPPYKPIDDGREGRETKGKLKIHELWSDAQIRSQLLEEISLIRDDWTYDSLNGAIVRAIAHFYCQPHGIEAVTEEDFRIMMKNRVWRTLRGYITWGFHGPSLVESMLLLGPEIVLDRIENLDVAWTYDKQAASSRLIESKSPRPTSSPKAA
ncbi:hypothetical protein EJ08DRAFT_629944 [Tothia fuscella]|uniref:Glutamate--tRNA ligase, mitochondrial n=1 Tax=Tothia fuscella TaxID=1048955 RepID=A0A9P4NX11_9PEZI|nr:hypothetical protein EJ08DRAFT_629944 [Tothia fuscella]